MKYGTAPAWITTCVCSDVPDAMFVSAHAASNCTGVGEWVGEKLCQHEKHCSCHMDRTSAKSAASPSAATQVFMRAPQHGRLTART